MFEPRFSPQFPELVRNARHKRAMTHQQLANKLGLSLNRIQQIENQGCRRAPPPAELHKLSQLLGVAISELLTALGYVEA